MHIVFGWVVLSVRWTLDADRVPEGFLLRDHWPQCRLGPLFAGLLLSRRCIVGHTARLFCGRILPHSERRTGRVSRGQHVSVDAACRTPAVHQRQIL